MFASSIVQIRESMQDAGADVFVCGLLDEVRLRPMFWFIFFEFLNINPVTVL